MIKKLCCFISYRKPHNPVTSSSIARLLKEFLNQAGVNTTAHSTRVASTSTAKMAGLSTKDIMKMADWSRESTFETYYHKPFMDSTTISVISYGCQGSSLNHTMSYMKPCHEVELTISQASKGCEIIILLVARQVYDISSLTFIFYHKFVFSHPYVYLVEADHDKENVAE